MPTGSSNFDGSQLMTTVNDLSVVEVVIDNLDDDDDDPSRPHGWKLPPTLTFTRIHLTRTPPALNRTLYYDVCIAAMYRLCVHMPRSLGQNERLVHD
ncbi:hypothetical protein DAEQUDRAFT_731727, partial [Daedalea quercina L-15889]